jgi:tetratricopeptide (TPR) repeat protein
MNGRDQVASSTSLVSSKGNKAVPHFVLRFPLNDNTGNFDALAGALRRETGAAIVRLDEEQWIVSSINIERPVTALFRGEETALRAIRLWLERLEVRDIYLISNDVAAQMVFAIGVEHRQQGRNEDALDWFERTLAIDDTIAPAWSNRANVLADLQRWDDAERSYRRALELSPADVLTHFNFGTFLINRNRYMEAASELRDAIRLDPEFEPAKRNLEVVEGTLRSVQKTIRDEP